MLIALLQYRRGMLLRLATWYVCLGLDNVAKLYGEEVDRTTDLIEKVMKK